MRALLSLLIVIYYHVSQMNASTSPLTPQCGDWQVFKEEKCLKVLDSNDLESYNGAQTKCSQNENSKLITIYSQEEQAFLISMLYHNYNIRHNVWLGAQQHNHTLKWVDNTSVNYTNLAHSAVNDTGCVHMSLEFNSFGEWFVDSCDIKNVVVCQKSQSTLYLYFQKQIMDLKMLLENTQKELKDIKNELNETKMSVVELQFSENLSNQMMESTKFTLLSKLEDGLMEMNMTLNSTQNETAIVMANHHEMMSNLKQNQISLQESVNMLKTNDSSLYDIVSILKKNELKLHETVSELKQNKQSLQITVSNLKQNIIPIGFIYVQFPREKTPQELLSWMTWQEITSSYAGLFFRAFGGNSSSFGSTQEENAPKIDYVYLYYYDGKISNVKITYKKLKASKFLWSVGEETGAICDFKFEVSSGEVRPRNTAIRIWKRHA